MLWGENFYSKLLARSSSNSEYLFWETFPETLVIIIIVYGGWHQKVLHSASSSPNPTLGRQPHCAGSLRPRTRCWERIDGT